MADAREYMEIECQKENPPSLFPPFKLQDTFKKGIFAIDNMV